MVVVYKGTETTIIADYNLRIDNSKILVGVDTHAMVRSGCNKSNYFMQNPKSVNGRIG